jgi:ATP synthase, F1 delta subunit
MTIGIISTRYARALYSLALDQAVEERVYREMKSIHNQFMGFPEIKRYLSSPIITKQEKVDILTVCAGGDEISEISKKFLSFVVARDKEILLPLMCVAYNRVYRRTKGILSVKLVSAHEINDEMVEKIRSGIERKYQSKVDLESFVDESIIGGFVVTVNNNRLDSSVAGELEKIKKELLCRN